MKIEQKSGGWLCEYTIDDETGSLLSIACSRPGSPVGPQRDVLGWQAEAGEEDQSQPGWDAA